MKKNIIKIVCFVCILALLLVGINSMLKFKYSDGIKQMTRFYEEEENTVDVLLLGSSHAFLNIYPEVLWRDFGYSSFNLSASLQPMWSTYHYLVEALKTQTPKVIVLEGYRLVEQGAYADRSTAIKSLYGMKWSQNKLDAIKSSVYVKGTLEDEAELFSPQELAAFEQLPQEFMNYHSRYSELNETDFLSNYGDPMYEYYKGGMVGTTEYTRYKQPDLSSYDTTPIALAEKTEEYYRKILELGEENGIPVVTVIAPFYIMNDEYQIFLAAREIAEEYGQLFIDYNELYDEIGLDFSTDILDAGSHLNQKGAEKLTKHIGTVLQDNFDIPDHRGDERYLSWELGAEMYQRAYGEKNGLAITADVTEYAKILLSDDRYSFAVVVNKKYDEYKEEKTNLLKALFEALGLQYDEIPDGVWFFEHGSLEYSNTLPEAFKKPYRFDRYNDIRFEYGLELPTDTCPRFFIREENNVSVPCKDFLTIYVYDHWVCQNVDTYVCDPSGNRK